MPRCQKAPARWALGKSKRGSRKSKKPKKAPSKGEYLSAQHMRAVAA